MIGMMYLVLTALLALQVSNTILEKFIFMDQSLEQSAANTKVKEQRNGRAHSGSRRGCR